MMNSNVMRYALLAVSVNKQNHLFQSNYLAGLVALGLYELEECGSLTWDGERCALGQPVPEDGRIWRGCTSPSPERPTSLCGGCW